MAGHTRRRYATSDPAEDNKPSKRLVAKIKNKVDVQHGLENAPATLRRLFEGRNEGKQLLRVAE